MVKIVCQQHPVPAIFLQQKRHARPKLKPEAHALLTALVAALSFPDKLPALDEFSEWREAEPKTLD